MPLETHPLFKKLADGDHLGAVSIEGYVGDAPEGRVRIHPALGDASYREFDADAILHTEHADDSVRVFVAPCTPVRTIVVHEVCGVAADEIEPSLHIIVGGGGDLSRDVCERLEQLWKRIQRLIANIRGKHTALDPGSLGGKAIIKELEDIEKVLIAMWNRGGCASSKT